MPKFIGDCLPNDEVVTCFFFGSVIMHTSLKRNKCLFMALCDVFAGSSESEESQDMNDWVTK